MGKEHEAESMIRGKRSRKHETFFTSICGWLIPGMKLLSWALIISLLLLSYTKRNSTDPTTRINPAFIFSKDGVWERERKACCIVVRKSQENSDINERRKEVGVGTIPFNMHVWREKRGSGGSAACCSQTAFTPHFSPFLKLTSSTN